jgi:hypothetical protein
VAAYPCRSDRTAITDSRCPRRRRFSLSNRSADHPAPPPPPFRPEAASRPDANSCRRGRRSRRESGSAPAVLPTRSESQLGGLVLDLKQGLRLAGQRGDGTGKILDHQGQRAEKSRAPP